MDLAEVPGVSFRRHPWEVARARFFRRVYDEAGLLSAPRTVLDVGAGDGYVARTLAAALPVGSSVVCFDAHYSDPDLAQYTATATTGLSFVRQQPTRRFDVLMLLDVLEHVPDDYAFLGDLVRENLAPGGSVVISVPAWQPLFSRHDEALKHYRRYSPAACRALLAGAGLSVRESGGLFHSLLLPRLARAATERLLRRLGRQPNAPTHLGEWRGGQALSSVLEGALAADNAVTHALRRMKWTLPGLSFWAACKRSDEPTRGGSA
jgi:SAM-dependent methyltransferase